MAKATCLIPSKTSKGTKVRTNTLRKNRKTDYGGVRKKMDMSVSSLVQPLSHWVKNSSTGDICWEGCLHRDNLKRMLIQHDWHLRSQCMWPSTWPFSLPSGKQAIFRTLTKQTSIKNIRIKRHALTSFETYSFIFSNYNPNQGTLGITLKYLLSKRKKKKWKTNKRGFEHYFSRSFESYQYCL